MNRSTLVSALALVCSSLLLAACDGGNTDTVENPFLGDNSTANQGPPAATDDVRAFEVNVWNNLRSQNRCGQCHGSGGQSPNFVDETDVNLAYSHAMGLETSGGALINLADPESSSLVTKVAAGHNCWEPVDSVCADAITNMISAWGGTENTETARAIELSAPDIRELGVTKSYPDNADDNDGDSFEDTIYPLLTQYCSACHYEEGSSQQQSPFFANPDDVDASYAAARAKINIDNPELSNFVRRLLDGHNCWSDCGTENVSTGEINGDAGEMLDEIIQFANAISPTEVDENLIISKAMRLVDGIVATGGNRHESNQIALWEFKTGNGTTAFDTSGIEPSVNLSISGNVEWLGAYGLDFSGGKAQADTQTSKKLHDFIRSTGEYSLEAWVIPANVTQEDANIVSFNAGSMQKNFAVTQTLYNYNFHNRTNLSDANGEAALSTPNEDEVLQSSLQHVVVTYDPVNGREIYVNGELIETTDPVDEPTTISNWDDTFALSMGNSIANNRTWEGQIRTAAVHNRILTPAQVLQNFDVGVGEKYFLLFSIADQIGIDDSYILFEVSQFDSYGYLFDQPTFVNLDPEWTPGGFAIKNLRIGINGKEATAGQAYANLDVAIDSSYDAATGQVLSPLGAVIALEKGSGSDEFFLTFETLGAQTNEFEEPEAIAAEPGADADPVPVIGVRTFEEVAATISKLTRVPMTNSAVNGVFQQYRQQLPSVETIDAFLSSHQMAIAQLALTACSERVDEDAAASSGDRELYTNFDFTQNAPLAFDSSTERDNAIDPILNAVLMADLTTQPDNAEIKGLLGSPTDQTLTWDGGSDTYKSLITEMLSCPVSGDPHYNEEFEDLCTEDSDPVTGINTSRRTVEIVKALCAAAVGSAAMLIQ